MAKMLRDKSGKVFLPAEQLKGMKGYTEFDAPDEADIPVVGDEAPAQEPASQKPASQKPAPQKPAAK